MKHLKYTKMKHYFSLLVLTLLGGALFLPMLITPFLIPIYLFGGIVLSLLFNKIRLIDVKSNKNIIALCYIIIPILIFSYVVVKKYMYGAEINNLSIILIVSTLILLFVMYYLIIFIINTFVEK